jgi:hypothetical protein
VPPLRSRTSERPGPVASPRKDTLVGQPERAQVYAHTTDCQAARYEIRNAEYSQKVGRDELFERERHEGPVAGWHSCDLACANASA